MDNKIKELKEEIQSIGNESFELKFMISSMECDLHSLESRQEDLEEEIEKIENSKEYEQWKENRTIIFPGQVSLMEVT